MSIGIRYMLFSIVSFSLMHVCVKAIPGIPVVQTIFLRSVFSIVFCYIAIRQAKVSVWGNNKIFLVLRGLVGMFSLICFFYSIDAAAWYSSNHRQPRPFLYIIPGLFIFERKNPAFEMALLWYFIFRCFFNERIR